MGCGASAVVHPGMDGGSHYSHFYYKPEDYGDDVRSAHRGEATYSKADTNDGASASESPAMTAIKRTFKSTAAYFAHGINSDAEQFTEDALKEDPKASRKDRVTVGLWVDDTLQAAIYQYIANNPKRSHSVLRDIAKAERFKKRGKGGGGGRKDGASDVDSVTDAGVTTEGGTTSHHSSAVGGERARPAPHQTTKSDKSAARYNTDALDGGKGGGEVSFDVRDTFGASLGAVVDMEVLLAALNSTCAAAMQKHKSGMVLAREWCLEFSENGASGSLSGGPGGSAASGASAGRLTVDNVIRAFEHKLVSKAAKDAARVASGGGAPGGAFSDDEPSTDATPAIAMFTPTPMSYALGDGPGSPTTNPGWKERTLTADALKALNKYGVFVKRQRKTEDLVWEAHMEANAPSIRTLVFGPCRYSLAIQCPSAIAFATSGGAAAAAALEKGDGKQLLSAGGGKDTEDRSRGNRSTTSVESFE